MTNELVLNNVHVEVDGKEIIHGVSLVIHLGEVHVLMGPNGSGKSTLLNAIMGHPRYRVTKGTILVDGIDITVLEPDKRARLGVFLSAQNPLEVEGVTLINLLRTAVNARREKPYSVMEFHQFLKEKMSQLQLDSSFSRRSVNVGFSGGEKKRAEMLQLAVLQPTYALLDETDSGLDVDALKQVAATLNALRDGKRSFLLVTHYDRILQYLIPDRVHIMVDGKIVKEGGNELVKEIEKSGYASLEKTVEHD